MRSDIELDTENRRGDQLNDHAVDFPPLENGVDYILSVAEYLTAQQPPTPRNLKYAVLHLQAAAEVLLKARLQLEHWILVFKEPGSASRQKFEEGDFESCNTTVTIARLRQIADVEIDEKSIKAIDVLAKSRNALQHFGLSTPARAIEARAAQVLDFLISFVYDQLLPELPGAEVDKVVGDLDAATKKLRTIRSFIDARLKRLTGKLKNVRHRTLKCPECDQWGLVAGDSDELYECHFCHFLYGSPLLALDMWVATQRTSGEDIKLKACPDCNRKALLDNCARVNEAPQERRTLCFYCGQ
ncbi:hypothetical protein [Streptomyces chilikensis]|uniref:hypothetical protein n=1 Tax=Streptomyces chilikensis TaxID=1194079 RepID=UPI001408E49E|nr:hypothetical protein [Streptomyces chilikensis]